MFFHELTMTNVGPFAGSTSVDLARVAQSGLFLLEGPTGTGKSTVLDSIVFALYGDMGVPHASTDRMRSSFAQPHEPSEVALVFETSGGVFRIQRTPSYDRQKKSGKGTTRQNSTVKLWRLSDPQSDPVDAPISTRHGEAEAEIQRIVGLNRAQFVQTILLPQGEFANFLRAKPESRRDLLQKIFGTELYDRIATELDNERRSALTERSKAQEQVGHAVTAFLATVDASPEQSDVLRAADVDDLPTLVSAMVGDLRTDAQQSEELVAACDGEYSRAQYSLRVGEQLARRRERLEQLSTRKRALEEGRGEEDTRRRLLRDLKMVERVSPTYASLERARAASIAAEMHYQNEVDSFEARFDVAATDPATQSQRVRLEIQSLESHLEQEAQLPLLADELSANRDNRETHAGALAELEIQKSALPARVVALSEKRDEARAMAAETNLLMAARTDATRRLGAARKAAELAAQSAASSQMVAAAEREAKAATTELGRLQQQRISGIAGELASALVEGAPCVVCGALEHPQPNRGTAAVDPDVLSQATGHVEELVALLAEEVDKRKRIEIDLAAALAHAVDRSVPQAQEELDLAEARLLASRDAQEDLIMIEADLDDAQKSIASMSATIDQKKQELSDCAYKIRTVEDLLRSTTRNVETARQQFATVHERATTLSRRADQLDQLATASLLVTDASSGLRTATANWEHAKQAISLSGDTPLADLLTQQSGLAAVSEEIAAVDREHAIVDAGLAELAKESSADSEAAADHLPDVDTLRKSLLVASTARDEARAELRSAQQLTARAQSTVDALVQALAKSVAVRESTAEIIRLSEIANATSLVNGPRVSLPTYVLMSRFHDVISAANTRLQAMSDGRFTLIH
ncbi:MAG: SMC family ATPase, partial [Actinobacteria bacterium]|nr:SMC family ATPase [Actinomycetota bacterium]